MVNNNANFNHNETWTHIKQLTITSKYLTPRDKNEMLAQEPTFNAIDDLQAIANACVNDAAGNARRASLGHLIKNANQQLKLYYLVGSKGWATAVNTIETAEAERLGVPERKAANSIRQQQTQLQ